MSTIIAATDPNTIQNAALGFSGAALLIAIVLMKVISSIIGKVVAAVVLVAVALVGYSQRSQITDCVNNLKNQAVITEKDQCSFLGYKFTPELPNISK